MDVTLVRLEGPLAEDKSPHGREDRIKDRHTEGHQGNEERSPHLALDRPKDRQGGNLVADGIASPIAQKDARRVEVVAQKPQQRPGQSGELQCSQVIGCMTVRITITTLVKKETPAARPSRPSIRFIALMKRRNQKTVMK